MAEIVDEKGNVRWYVELTCPVGHEVRASGRLVKHKSGTQSFVVDNVERGCIYCHLHDEKQKRAAAEMEKDGWRIVGTGGGCEAWFKRVGEESYLVTLEDDPNLPVVGQPAKLGHFDNVDADGEADWTTRVDVFDGPQSIVEANAAERVAQEQDAAGGRA